MLKLNNQIILNAWDFQKYFSPWESYRQLAEVAAFARVHCQKLATVLLRNEPGKTSGLEEKRYAARYLDKEFWIQVVEEGRNSSAWKYEDKSVKACMQNILRAKFEEDYTSPEQNKPLLQEYTDAKIDEKLQYIISSGKLSSSAQDIRAAVILLALCELAEADVFSQSFRRWEVPPAKPQRLQPVSAPEGETSQDKRIPPAPKHKTVQAELLPEVEILRLETRGIPYNFCYYEQEELEKGQVIRSVRVEAVMGRDQSRRLTLQMLHPKTNQVVVSTVLNAGEYRDCTVVNGKIIKLLPTMAVSRNLFVARKLAAHNPRFDVVPFGSDPWAIDMDLDKVKSITCLAAGDERNQGFLMVSGGEVITSFYKPCEDYFVRMEMQMIADPIVEVKIEPDGYCLLTGAGTVISDIPKWNGRENQISLSEFGRKPTIKIENMEGVTEVVMNGAKDSLALRDRDGKIDVIFADDPSRRFRKNSSGFLCI